MDSPPDVTGREPESYTWPLVAIAIAILPQVLIPAHDRIGPLGLVPVMETAAFLVMLIIAAKPGPVPRAARHTILVLFSLLAIANTIAATRLVVLVLTGSRLDGQTLGAQRLLVAGGLVLMANVITFGLLYWELDSGGPRGRVSDPMPYPDFHFPQVGIEGLAPPGWRPRFGDFLYVAFTGAVAFSPTDAMPLTLRAKALMALQAMTALAVVVVVLARVINILPG